MKFADGLCHVVGKGKHDVDSVLIARCSSGNHLNLHICVAHNSLVLLWLAWLWGESRGEVPLVIIVGCSSGLRLRGRRRRALRVQVAGTKNSEWIRGGL